MDQNGVEIKHAQITPESARQIEEVMKGAQETINGIIENDVQNAAQNAAPPPNQASGVLLSWDPPLPDAPQVAGYSIWRHDGSFWKELVASTGNTNTTYIDTDPLNPNQWYWYAIRALTVGGGVGEWSAVIPHLYNPGQAGPPRRFQANTAHEQAECCENDEPEEIVVRRYSSKQIDALHGNLDEQACVEQEYVIENEMTWEVGEPVPMGGSITVRW